MQEIYTGKRPPKMCSSYRDVSVTDTSGKNFHSTLRNLLLS